MSQPSVFSSYIRPGRWNRPGWGDGGMDLKRQAADSSREFIPGHHDAISLESSQMSQFSSGHVSCGCRSRMSAGADNGAALAWSPSKWTARGMSTRQKETDNALDRSAIAGVVGSREPEYVPLGPGRRLNFARGDGRGAAGSDARLECQETSPW